jgi:hypothetical protein
MDSEIARELHHRVVGLDLSVLGDLEFGIVLRTGRHDGGEKQTAR